MDTVLVMFTFTVGACVRWRDRTGPRYRIRRRRYSEDEAGNERYEYLLHQNAAPGYDFWAQEGQIVGEEP